MPTKKTIVVPCMVIRRLKTCGETKWLFGHDELEAHDRRLEPGDEEEDEPGGDVHDARAACGRR